MKKSLVVLLAMLVVIMSISGCGKKGDTVTTTKVGPGEDVTTTTTTTQVQDVSLKVWAPEEEQELYATLLDRFKAAHPEYNITFDLGIMGNADSSDALKVDLDVAADVFVFPSAAIPELTQAGILYPLTVDLDSITSINGEGTMSAVSLGGQVYGIPETPNSWFMYYNKSMYTEDDIANLDTMLAKDLGSDVLNFSTSISDSWYMAAFFYAVDGTLYGKDGLDPNSCSFNDANGMKAGKYLIDLSKNPKYIENRDGIADSLFKEGKLGAMCSGTWVADGFKEALGDNLGAYKLPTITIEGKDYQLSNFGDYRAIGVKSSTAFPLAAQQLAAFLGNEQSQLERFITTAIAPTAMTLVDNELVKENIGVTGLLMQSAYSTPQPSTPQLSEYWTPAIALGTGIVNGDITEANLQENLDLMVKGITTPAVQ